MTELLCLRKEQTQKRGQVTSTSRLAVLRSLSAYHQAGSALGHRLFTALAYPAFLLLTALAVVVFLSTQTLPQLMEMLVASGRAVPPITQAVTLAGGILARWWWAILAGVILGVAPKKGVRSPPGEVC